MGCGCSKTNNQPKMTQVPNSFFDGVDPKDRPAFPTKPPRGPSMQQANAVPAAFQQSAGGGTYDDSLGCRRCYAKHLSKAVVELTEYLEDKSRYEELSLCMGDIACAEDHAAALELLSEKDRLRSIREQIWNANLSVVVMLRAMASSATMSAVLETARENANRVSVPDRSSFAALRAPIPVEKIEPKPVMSGTLGSDEKENESPQEKPSDAK